MLLTIGALGTLRMISIEAHHAFTRRFYNRLRHFTKARNLFSIGRKVLFIFLICLVFSFLYLPMLLYAFLAIFILIAFDFVCLKSVRLKLSDCLSHFLDLNYRGLNLSFVKLVQLLIDGDV